MAAFRALAKRPKPKAIIFDWDNTLVDTWPLIHAAINATMIAMKKEEWSLKKVQDNIHKAMRDSFPEIFGDNWQEAGEIYVNTYRSINLDRLKFFPLIGSHDANADKPNKAPVELALLGSNLDPKKDEIWFVGYTIADVNCAYNTHCQPIIYGHQDGISKTIPQEIYENGREGKGAIALFFDYRDFIDLIEK